VGHILNQLLLPHPLRQHRRWRLSRRDPRPRASRRRQGVTGTIVDGGIVDRDGKTFTLISIGIELGREEALETLRNIDRLARGGETHQSRVSRRTHKYSTPISHRGRDAGAATSNNFSGLWPVAGRKNDNFYGAPPGSPCTHDLHGHPNYGSRDGENRRPVLVCLLGAAVLT
jgi:hypothetical protein